ncbi:GNAT family N-acetyltransferase [Haloarchaeobius sp. HME9146]|uniref:GNAT family N-acetyltransferase n=1 Tax=Haloarchaeobius sp. HME9146 TaxID=2978732 RepID=UPI0021C0CB5F|nr:GNAT family protein [Haloarchaeobius sp. HME9146]MCT9097114.1 GNAT family N-acetyltransferase [Haloarchaeobius sp. HME9146]
MPGATFLSGETVDLCTIEEDDIEFLRDGINDPAVRVPVGNHTPYNLDEQRDWLENVASGDDEVNLCIVPTEGDEPVGVVTIAEIDETHGTAELGYWVAPEHHRNGYGSDAARTMVEYAFRERRIRSLMACVFAFNEASAGLLESVGFERTGTWPEWVFVDGEHHDVWLYTVTADEWLAE